MERSEVKSFLDRGDYVKIARLVGQWTDLTKGRKAVYRLLSDKAQSNSCLSKLVWQKAIEVAEQNKAAGKLPTTKPSNQ